MIIEKLRVSNYRVFAGEHEFDLKPRTKYGSKRPIILFGGLNGAGKTSILSAIRLALYGKQSLGLGITQKQYDEYLINSIHKNSKTNIKQTQAAVEVSFTYAKLGERFDYTVTREWVKSGKSTKEFISISENGILLENLSYDQCQGFLNELIPIGLSNLFFFDGEKIAELAEDTKGAALGDAIKRLIGLDQFDILGNDLGVLIRNKQPELIPKDSAKEIIKIEQDVAKLETEIETALQEFEFATISWTSVSQDIDRAENELQSKGGAWSASYEEEKKLEGELTGEKKALENSIRELIAGKFPLALAKQFNKSVLKQLELEKRIKSEELASSHFMEKIDLIKEKLAKNKLSKDKADATIETLRTIFQTEESFATKLIHQVSEPSHYRIINSLKNAEINFNDSVASLKRLNQLNEQIDQVGLNLSRAPSLDSIQKEFEKIGKLKDEQSRLQVKRATYAERYKKLLQEKLNLLRSLDKLTENVFSEHKTDRTIDLASKARALLKKFSLKMAESKVKDLESEFVNSFQRLARKEDIQLKAKIDPKSFGVEIIRDDSHIVDKNELSAGEKQIYAIAILEALARTSGRKLPIIIDTPLGRLDSKHRNKLIKNYFPNASHQVIILSTDTEVDEAFYSELNTSISHAYRLDYNPETASTHAKEGYFWKKKQQFKEAV
ncbi:DNA sulfur modification protein DndD [Aliikangiella sp. IMCC44632]